MDQFSVDRSQVMFELQTAQSTQASEAGKSHKNESSQTELSMECLKMIFVVYYFVN